jgi:hypothetical protein
MYKIITTMSKTSISNIIESDESDSSSDSSDEESDDSSDDSIDKPQKQINTQIRTEAKSIEELRRDEDESKEEADDLKKVVIRYHTAWNNQKKKNKLYESVIFQLTGETIEKFIKKDSKGIEVPDQEYILNIKTGGDVRVLINKYKRDTQTDFNTIKTLEETNSFFRKELLQLEYGRQTIKDLQIELNKIKQVDPVERKKETFNTLISRRKHVSVNEIKNVTEIESKILDIKDYILSLLPDTYILDEDEEINIKDELIKEQTTLEISLIEHYISLLKYHYEILPNGVVRIDKTYVACDVYPILEAFQESREKLSYYMDEKTYIKYITTHIQEITEILDLFNSKIRSIGTLVDGIHILLSPYEKGLLFYKENDTEHYFHSSDKFYDVQKRLKTGYRLYIKTIPFVNIADLQSSHLFSQLENSIEVLLITSKVNNIVYVPAKEDIGPDYVSFYYLEYIQDNIRHWKLDTHLFYIIRTFSDKYIKASSIIFKQFYKDVFGHNEYIPGFEEMIESKKIKRWNQIKILYENMQIVSDENLLGEIIRKMIRSHAVFHPKEDVDSLQSLKTTGDSVFEFKTMRERWKQGLPACEEEPEEYLDNCFNKYRDWRRDQTRETYYNRWKTFLKQEKYC